MSDIREAIVAEIKKDDRLKAKLLVSNKWYVFPVIVPENYLKKDTQDYFMTYFLINGPEDQNIDLQTPTLQINCFATSYSKSIELSEDIKRIFSRFKGTLGDVDYNRKVYSIFKTDEVDLYDDTAKLFFRPLRFQIVYLGDNV